jgi:hypothetical protein
MNSSWSLTRLDSHLQGKLTKAIKIAIRFSPIAAEVFFSHAIPACPSNGVEAVVAHAGLVMVGHR